MTQSDSLAPGSRRATLRPVRATDTVAMQAFVASLGAADRRLRFHGAVNACAPGLLRHLTQADGVRHVAFVACIEDDGGGGGIERIVGEARYFVAGAAADGDTHSDHGSAEFAIAVAGDQRGRGVADALLRALLGAAAEAGIGRLHGDVLAGNLRMAAFMQRHRFEIDPSASAEPGIDRWQCAVAAGTRPTSTRPGLAALGAWLGRVAGQRLAL